MHKFFYRILSDIELIAMNLIHKKVSKILIMIWINILSKIFLFLLCLLFSAHMQFFNFNFCSF